MAKRQRQAINGGGDVVLASAQPVQVIAPDSLNYDYDQIDEAVRDNVIDAVHAIRDNYADADRAYRQAHAGIVETGRKLHYLRDTVPHGQFEAIVEAEFPFSSRQARNIMAGYDLARQLEDQGKSEIISVFKPTVLGLLAAPSVPATAVDAAVSEVEETGTSPTVARAKEIIAEHKPPAVSIDEMVPTVEAWLESYAPGANLDERIDTLEDVLNTSRESIRRNSLQTALNNAHGIGVWQWQQGRRTVERVLVALTVQQPEAPQAPTPPPAHQPATNGAQPRYEPPAQPRQQREPGASGEYPIINFDTGYAVVRLSWELMEELADLADQMVDSEARQEFSNTIGMALMKLNDQLEMAA